MSRITVLALYDRVSVFHSLVPLLFSRQRDRFIFTDDPSYCLRKDRNRVLFMVRCFLKPDLVDLNLLKKLRDKYQRIFFFNDNAGGGIPRLEVLPYVDRLFNKALFRDRGLYRRSLYGGELYSDFYHRRFGVTDPDHRERAVLESDEDIKKLGLSWNIGIGDYPRGKLRQRMGVLCARLCNLRWAGLFFARHARRRALGRNLEQLEVHARLDFQAKPSIAFQRRLILSAIENRPEFLTGRVSQRRFNHEIRQSKITLSPFGWGEICLRDFEAILNRSLLLKPDMSHLETWPDVFIPMETYIPFQWDGSDLLEKARFYLAEEEERRRITARARQALEDQAGRLEERLEGILGALNG